MNRNTVAAQKIRDELIKKLGGFCVLCGEDDPAKMEFDHTHGRDWTPNKLSYRQRLTRYRREAEQGLIRLLCGTCNREQRKKNDNGAFVPTVLDVPLTEIMDF